MSLVIASYQNDLCSSGVRMNAVQEGRQGGASVKAMVECVISILRPLNYPLNK